MMQSRTHTCGQLRLANAGEKVTLCGWMENVRVVGQNFAFVVLRDFYGTTQIVVETEQMMNIIKSINKESTIPVSYTHLKLDHVPERTQGLREIVRAAERFGEGISGAAKFNEQGTGRLVLVEALGAQIDVAAESRRDAVQQRLELQRVGQILLPVRMRQAALI